MSKEKEEKLAKLKIDIDPGMIKSQIDKLERRIETDAPSFEKEKELMKQIKSLRKQLNETKGVTDVHDKMRAISKQIDAAKDKAESFHKQLTERLQKNKSGYNEFMTISKKINELKAVQEKAFENFTTFKKEFSEMNRQLNEKYKEKHAERKVKAKQYDNFKQSKKQDD